MALRVVLLWLLLRAAQAQNYPFCTTGTNTLALADDGGYPSVDVIVAQAPLFSTNPSIGQKFGWLGIYHTTIVLAQTQANASEPRFWTLEFDYTGGNVLRSIIPDIIDGKMTWNKSARFCLSDGLLWGRGHWTKTFEKVARLSAAEAQRTLTEFIVPLNSTSSSMPPQYQLWQVARPTLLPWRHAEVLIHDATCADGANWILHYVAKVAKVPLVPHFKFKATHVVIPANRVERVSPEDGETWKDMVEYFRTLSDLVAANKTMHERLVDVLHLVRDKKYVHDSNSGVYYRLVGNRDRFHFSYEEYPMEGPFFQNFAEVHV